MGDDRDPVDTIETFAVGKPGYQPLKPVA